MPRGVPKNPANAPLPATASEALAGTPTQDKAEVERILTANADLAAKLEEAQAHLLDATEKGATLAAELEAERAKGTGSAHTATADASGETPSSHPVTDSLDPSVQVIVDRLLEYDRTGYLGALRVAEADLRTLIRRLSR